MYFKNTVTNYKCKGMAGFVMARAHSFPWKFCQIPRASSRNYEAHCGKIVQIPRLATASH